MGKKKAAKKPAADKSVEATHGPAGQSPVSPPQSDAAPLSRFQKFEPARISRRDLRKAPYNPRILSPSARRKLNATIKKFGFVGGIIWNRRTGNLVSGHQRIGELDALEGSDNYSLTVDVIDVDEQTEKALNIALNNPSTQGQFDLLLLQDIIGQLSATEYDIHATGFSTSDFHAMFGDDFLTGVFKEQVDNEAPQVAMLEEMRQAGREADKQQSAKGSSSDGERDLSFPAGQTTSPDSNAGRLPQNVIPTPPSENLPHAAGPDRTPPPSSTFEGYDFSAGPPDAATAPDAYAAYKRFLHARRAKYRDAKSGDEDQADVMITIVFDRSEEIVPFLRKLGLDEEQRYFDVREVESAIYEISTDG